MAAGQVPSLAPVERAGERSHPRALLPEAGVRRGQRQPGHPLAPVTAGHPAPRCRPRHSTLQGLPLLWFCAAPQALQNDEGILLKPPVPPHSLRGWRCRGEGGRHKEGGKATTWVRLPCCCLTARFSEQLSRHLGAAREAELMSPNTQGTGSGKVWSGFPGMRPHPSARSLGVLTLDYPKHREPRCSICGSKRLDPASPHLLTQFCSFADSTA